MSSEKMVVEITFPTAKGRRGGRKANPKRDCFLGNARVWGAGGKVGDCCALFSLAISGGPPPRKV